MYIAVFADILANNLAYTILELCIFINLIKVFSRFDFDLSIYIYILYIPILKNLVLYSKS